MKHIKHSDSKQRWYDGDDCDYDVHKCDSGGKYQELKTLGAFAEALPGSRMQRLGDNNYCKENLSAKSNDSIADLLGKKDTNGPPYENVSVPKRVF